MTTLVEPGTRPDAVLDAPVSDGRRRRVRVRRTPRLGGEPPQERFVVPVTSARTTVLDALAWIRAHLDPTLDVRHACFHASCGTCGMRVDGREVLACVTRLDDLPEGEVDVEPLRNLRVVSDLVVDLESIGAALAEVGLPPVRRSEGVAGAPPPDGIEDWTRFEDCIECGLCLSACPIEGTDEAYLGPAVLAAAWRSLEEPRATDPARVARLADLEQGAWRCHLAFACTAACPSDALPGEAIGRLRGALLRRRLWRALDRHGRRDGHRDGGPDA
jgi:succinate dehydrogenase / fumarate reductase iron-sulfur subunit